MAYDLKRVSVSHEMIMNWMILNPDRPLRECAEHFGITQPWLSSLIHSDLFQAYLRTKLKDVSIRVADSIPERLRACADIALDKLATKLSETEDPDFILEAADKVLHRMGFAPASARNPVGAPQVVQQNNVYVTSRDDLERARALMAQGLVQIEKVPEEVEAPAGASGCVENAEVGSNG